MATTTRPRAPTTSRTTRTTTRTKTATVSPDELASDVARKLTITDSRPAKGKAKAPQPQPLTAEERRANAMRAVNATSKSLSDLVASSQSKKGKAFATAEGLATTARNALRGLRELGPREVDTERAASSIAGKLVSLEMDRSAMEILRDMRPALVALYAPNATPDASSPMQLLTLPLPSPDVPIPEVVLNLIATFLLHTMTVLVRSMDDLSTLLATLHDASNATLLIWTPHLIALPAKHHASLFTRTYTAVAKAASLPGVAIQHAFALRMHALECLARTRPGVIVPDTFWDQATKWARVHAAEPIAGDEARVQDFLKAVEGLVGSIDNREDRDLFLESQGFAQFCEVWVFWAQQMGNLEAVDSIMELTRKSSSRDGPSSSGQPAPGSSGASLSIMPDATTICMLLSQATAVFERWAECLPQDRAARLEGSLTAVECSSVFTSAPGDDSETARVRDKVRRGLERLRRMVIKVLEPTSQENMANTALPQDARNGARMVLQRISEVLCDAIRKNIEYDSDTIIDSDITTPALETLLVLARTALIIRNPDTYSAAWDTLQQAKTLVFLHVVGCSGSRSPVPSSVILDVLQHPREKSAHARVGWTPATTATLANYTRCVAGAFHNVAGTLCQAERISHAVRFLNEGCELGRVALAMHDAVGDGKDSSEGCTRELESWRQLQEQLWHRWEILGVCQAKTGDRKLALEAFIEALKVFPLDIDSLSERLGATSVAAVFNESPSLQQLGKILDRVTYIGACELFLEPEVISAKTWYTILGVGSGAMGNKAVLGALLERQIASLGGSRWKKGVDCVVKQLLRHALSVYEAGAFPVRRTRIFIQLLETAYYATAESEDGRILGMTADDVGTQAKALLSCEDPKHDAAFSVIRPGLLATLHLWLALHAHRYMESEAAFATIARHADEACKILNSMLHQSRLSFGKQSMGKIKPPSELRAPTAKKPTRKVAAALKSRSGIPRTTRTARTQPTEPPVTPRPRRALNDISLNAAMRMPPAVPPVKSVVPTVPVDLPSMVDLIQMVAQLSGMLGHVFIKVHLLSLARRLSEQCASDSCREYLITSIDLAYEYSQLGKTNKAISIYSHVLRAPTTAADPELRLLLYLQYAEALAAAGQMLQSASTYCEALAILENLSSTEDKGMSTAERVRQRVSVLERAALAARAFATIQHARDDPSTSIDGLLQSLRLWNRAMETMARMRPPPPGKQQSSEFGNPFEITKDTADGSDPSRPRPLDERAAANQLDPQRMFQRRAFMDGTEWRLAEGLLITIFALVRAYYARGSPREADYFIQQASSLAHSLNAPAMIGRALARQGEISLRLGHLEEGHELLVEAGKLMSNVCGPDAVDIHRLRGEYSLRSADDQGAQQLYAEATAMLDELGKMFAGLDTNLVRKSLNSLRRSSAPKDQNCDGALAPSLLAALLRQHITLLRDAGEDYNTLLQRFSALPPTTETKAEESVLTAKLTLEDVFSQFRADMFLSSLAESAIMIPMGILGERVHSTSPITQEILNTLSAAERSLKSDLSLITHRGNVSSVRDTAISLALISALQSSLGDGSIEVPFLVAQLIDLSTAITLRREMLEAIKHKFAYMNINDLQLPQITPNGTPIPRMESPRRVQRDVFLDPEDDPEGIDSTKTDALKAYWKSVAARYQTSIFNGSHSYHADRQQLPSNWTVINISITEDKNMLFITRQRADRDPLAFCLPLRGRRENDEDEHLTFSGAIEELKEILRLNDEGTRGTVNVKNDRNARAAWWAARHALDQRLQDLLGNIEFCWFGAFKTILSAPVQIADEYMDALRMRIDALFASSLVSRSRDRKTYQHARVKLDDALLECFAALPPDCRVEEIEDLVYFVLDLYQFHGVPVAIAEVDVDRVVIDLRNVLEEHRARVEGQRVPVDDHHVFLVLDKNVQGIPWESLPVLRGQSISRIPNMDFLIDRLELARLRSGVQPRDGRGVVDRMPIDPTRAYYILNPSGDLKNTQERFATWAKGMRATGWDGIVGKVPSEQQLVDALTRNDLVVYFGHGGAEQYVRSLKIRHLPRCAATMLWGCSSGILRDMGDFDRTGTPYNYMLAGCPTLVANLWDVTDRDIDKLSQAVFDDLHLTPDGVRAVHANPRSVVAAVAQARDSCKLKYLTGAAPVVYGIPFYL